MIQQAFEFGPAGEKPKPKAAQRKPTQRPTAARANPSDDKKLRELESKVKKLTESNKTLNELSDVLHNAHMRSMLEVRNLKNQNALLEAMVREAYSENKALIPCDMLARLIRLAHPDKHGNSQASNEATSWLLSQRKAR